MGDNAFSRYSRCDDRSLQIQYISGRQREETLLGGELFNGCAWVPPYSVHSEVLPEVEYEYEFVPLYIYEQKRTSIYAKTERSTRTYRPPYACMPRIKSRAHPLFVIFKMVDVLILFISTLDSKERAYTCSAIDVAKCWEATPPPEFLIGPDVWQSHRHPMSDDGYVAQAQLKGGKRTRTRKQPRNVRKSTRAPCSQPKAHTRPSIYDRQQRPIKEMTSALPLYRVSGRTESSSGLSEPELHDWMETARGQASAPPDSTADDRLLAEYQKERARDPDNALRLRNVYDLGGVITGPRGSDRSRYSSNDWAMHVFNTCLWTCKGNPKAWRSQRRTQLQRGEPKINILYNTSEKGRTCRGENQRKQV